MKSQYLVIFAGDFLLVINSIFVVYNSITFKKTKDLFNLLKLKENFLDRRVKELNSAIEQVKIGSLDKALKKSWNRRKKKIDLEMPR